MIGNTLFFTIPYAGGSVMSLSNITHKLKKDKLEIHRLELPGRGMRQDEILYNNLENMVEDLCRKIIDNIQFPQQPIILWGHSMGGILALLIAYNLSNRNYNISGLLVSAMRAPYSSTLGSGGKLSQLSAFDFKSIINKLIPAKYKENITTTTFQNFLKRQENVLKVDIEALENFKLDNWLDVKIKSPIFVLRAKEDELMPDRKTYDNWKLHTDNYTQYYMMDGGHFFTLEYPQKTVDIIEKIINKILIK